MDSAQILEIIKVLIIFFAVLAICAALDRLIRKRKK